MINVEKIIMGLMIGVVSIKVNVVWTGMFFFINWWMIGMMLYLYEGKKNFKIELVKIENIWFLGSYCFICFGVKNICKVFEIR